MDTVDQKEEQKQPLTDELKKTLSNELLKKFQKDFKKILADFTVIERRHIIKTFMEITEISTSLMYNIEGRDPWNYIEAIYTKKLIEKYNEKFAKTEKTGIINYFSRTRILNQTTKLDGFKEQRNVFVAVDEHSNEKIINLSIFFSLQNSIADHLKQVKRELDLTPAGDNDKEYPALVKWNGSKVDFIKLIYGLYHAGKFDAGPGITVITEKLAKVFDVDYKNPDNSLSTSLGEASKNGHEIYKVFDEIKKAFEEYVKNPKKHKKTRKKQ